MSLPYFDPCFDEDEEPWNLISWDLPGRSKKNRKYETLRTSAVNKTYAVRNRKL